MPQPVRLGAVTFDVGQTLLELDTGFLADRLAERGVIVTPEALDRACPDAWQAFAILVGSGQASHATAWKTLLCEILRGAGVKADLAGLADWLWVEQSHENLWRRPIAGMVDLVDDLRTQGVRVAVISNSEGKLAELLAKIGWSDRFACIADSGQLGIEKPDPRIFAWTLARLGVTAAASVHIGDSWTNDIVAARHAGMRAIWFGPQAALTPDPEVPGCVDARGLRAVLRGWGLHRL